MNSRLTNTRPTRPSRMTGRRRVDELSHLDRSAYLSDVELGHTRLPM